MINTITIKQNNIYALSCTTDQSIGGNPIHSAILVKSIPVELAITNITDTSFVIQLDTTSLPIGILPMDIKIGNVSSETIFINVIRGIA